MTSIIIPAHNEAATIGNNLTYLLEASKNLAVQIIIVCNGCHDKTAEIVNSFQNEFLCLETQVASKTFALNLGDQQATSYPRIYLDADVLLPQSSIEAIVKKLEEGYLAVAPEVKMDFTGCSWAVKAFYEIWLALPYCQAGMIGAGVYALSEQGRQRFDVFPNIIADDGYIRCLFSESERTAVKGVYSIVKAPKNLWCLIKIKTRSRLGRYELERKYPLLINNELKNYRSALKQYFFNVKKWPELSIYLIVNLISRLRAIYQTRTRYTQWERDESNR
jgi:glycosyltransferase involved in cell wall biosynthesis